MEGDLILSLLTEIKDKLELFLTLTDTGSLSWTVLGQILNLINIETIIVYKPPPLSCHAKSFLMNRLYQLRGKNKKNKYE